MKSFNILVVFLVLILGCGQNQKQPKTETENQPEPEYAAFGEKITPTDAKKSAEIAQVFEQLKLKDTISTKFSAIVTDVCQAKGCWMKLDLQNGTKAMVKFKDYGFFVPKDIAGKEVVVNGIAFVDEMSVEDQRHYAEDAGKTADEIAAITAPKRSYGFEAEGVLVKE